MSDRAFLIALLAIFATFVVLDASGPGPTPTLLSETPLDTGIEGGRAIALEGDLAYVLPNIADDLSIVDVSDPGDPEVLGFLDGVFSTIAVDGALLVTSEGNPNSGLRIWDASIPGSPIQRAFVPLGPAEAAGLRSGALRL